LKNSAQFGGGILCDTSAFYANGSTIKGNTALTSGGGFCSLANSQAMNFTNANVSSNTISAGAAANGGGLYVSGATLNAYGYNVNASGNSASAGGNDYAFTVSNTSDGNYNTSQNGPSGINYFTNNTGSLRSAISYCQNWMNGNANNHSMAIMLSPSTSDG